MSRNGVKQQERARERLQREQAKDQVHANQHSTNQQKQPFDKSGTLRREYIEAITDTSLQPGTINILQNLVTRDWVLGNLKEPEITEERWLLETTKVEVFAMHPRQGATATGARRAYELDDEMETLSPLTDQERKEIENFLRGIWSRVTRSRGGWQQEMNSKTISVSKTHDERESKDGLFSGIFGG